MAINRPKWKRAPVVEVVVAVQFEPLQGLTNGHLGWFWGDMHQDFPRSDDVPAIPQVVEDFSGALPTFIPGFGLRRASGEARLRMTSTDGAKMVQIQNGWLVANWSKHAAVDYPGFTGVKETFDIAMHRFQSFLQARKLGVLRPTLWEVTYIDHVPKGTVWEQTSDIGKVFPGLFGGAQIPHSQSESVDATWTWRMQDQGNQGRLRLSVQSAATTGESQNEILLIRSVARGTASQQSFDSLNGALNFGRSIAVDTFMGVISEDAKRYWQGL